MIYRRLKNILCCAGFGLLGLNALHAQSSSFLGDGTQDFVRRMQLLGKVGIDQSLSAQSYSSVFTAIDTLLPAWRGKTSKMNPGALSTEWLPASATLQFNSHHPFGSNDGSMIPSKGLQTVISAGLVIRSGHFSLQLKPEFVSADNASFQAFSTEMGDVFWNQYYRQLNRIDAPEKFGANSYNRVFAGQSSIRYTTGALSFGLSTENLWWGPGRYNALVMSNNAPGFAHFTLNTIRPIQTKIGSFEGQFVGGLLTSSGIALPDTNRVYNGVRLYQPKQDLSRYLAGLNFSWQPAWIRGLFLGFTSVSYLYGRDMTAIDVLPLGWLFRSSTENKGLKASTGSLYARYVMPEDHAELYFEYGRNDRSPNPVNIIKDNDYPRGYVAGFRKLFASHRKHQIEVAGEFTQLQLPSPSQTFALNSWYTHPYVRQGYTNEGQVIGSGLGMGSNSQLLDLSWVQGTSKFGVKFERIAHNNDFYYNAFLNTSDFTRHWIDVGTTFHADGRYKQFFVSAEAGLIRSLNYEFYIFPDLGYFKNGYDVINFHGKVSVAYRF